MKRKRKGEQCFDLYKILKQIIAYGKWPRIAVVKTINLAAPNFDSSERNSMGWKYCCNNFSALTSFRPLLAFQNLSMRAVWGFSIGVPPASIKPLVPAFVILRLGFLPRRAILVCVIFQRDKYPSRFDQTNPPNQSISDISNIVTIGNIRNVCADRGDKKNKNLVKQRND